MKTRIRIPDHADHLPHFCFLKWGRQEGGEQWRIVASLPALCSSGRLQSQTQEGLDALLASLLDRAQMVFSLESASVVRQVEPLRSKITEFTRHVEGLFESLLNESFGGENEH